LFVWIKVCNAVSNKVESKNENNYFAPCNNFQQKKNKNKNKTKNLKKYTLKSFEDILKKFEKVHP
jgi:hypothetical protein